MMNFIAYNPTKLHFGRGVTGQLGSAALKLGKHALLVYGGGSVLQNGSYADTFQQLRSHGIGVTEFGGIRPNPRVEDVNTAASLGRAKGTDLVVAVGGGSVIDSAKIIAICIADGCEAWDVMSGKHTPVSSLPLVAVLTLAATGTEMNAVSVLQNPVTREKIGFRNDLMYPVHSFLDPGYTLSVPSNYTAYGVVDLVAHCFEAWFGEGDASLSDRFVVSIVREAMEYGPALMKDLENYDLRARIMWAATNALNNQTSYGRKSGDWGVHALGHNLSFLFDTPHGASLSILYPAWMRALKREAGNRIVKLGGELFGTTDAESAIEGVKDFFVTLGSPVRCSEAGIEFTRKGEILELMNRNRAEGLHHKLSDAKREEILEYTW
jgi:alcohol dehydrogenase YqhD (iron-dependent ADH family)